MPHQGEILTLQRHFQYHIQYAVPVEIYRDDVFVAIGVVTAVDEGFVELQGTLYNRGIFTFVSRPGY
ncbi:MULTISPECIES: hypothetical protein [Paenibacillus]|uniref:hypothetical protein n=1 Tax=Paenibacillus TaxID=44249 RepID=UPI00076D020C|nr:MULTISPECIES: hypothetical protein [Paenibacillus]KUP21083.1 hypothetical protein AWJ19_04410 [Paenibacillus sp. DMB5]MBY0014204.1 hypothetical protein [Paenibacillus typhae]MDF9844681.1 hypothetical protein [Paenibacillus sp. PastF-2]MDF9851258.1 hypothetical protein [Paenibacillus sp. PastM-2]MDF9857841.1 hypothetical protein [Paenibacillus sp. PastF-1]